MELDDLLESIQESDDYAEFLQEVTVRERPILFSSEMVRAILEGRKTQTRRVVKPQSIKLDGGGHPYLDLGNPPDWDGAGVRRDIFCPYGLPGDRLWVRETWAITYEEWGGCQTEDGFEADCWLTVYDKPKPTESLLKKLAGAGLTYRADYPDREGPLLCDMVWRPSIFMPRWASRILLEVKGIKVERVQDISKEEIDLEGTPPVPNQMSYRNDYYQRLKDFEYLWDSLDAKKGYSWSSNPWVWVVTFSVLEAKDQ